MQFFRKLLGNGHLIRQNVDFVSLYGKARQGQFSKGIWEPGLKAFSHHLRSGVISSQDSWLLLSPLFSCPVLVMGGYPAITELQLEMTLPLWWAL